MIAVMQVTVTPDLARLHGAFLALLPRIEAAARVAFRRVACPARRDDCVAEAVAVAWSWFVALARRGKDAVAFAAAFAALAVRAVKGGRRLCGHEKARDALSPLAQRRHHFRVGSIPEGGPGNPDADPEALADTSQSPPDERAAFALDFPAWRSRLRDRDRLLLDDLMAGERPGDAARRRGLSPTRVSQLRRAFRDGWRAFCGDQPEGRATATNTTSLSAS